MNGSELLKKEFDDRRKRNPAFSLRSFARWLELSPAQTSQLMSGKRPFTLASVQKISVRLGLSPAQRHRFIESISAAKSGSDENRQSTAKRLLREDEFRLIGDWYHLAILSLTKTRGAKPDPRWVAKRLGITAADANRAIQRLVRMGLLETSPRFRQLGEPFEVVSSVPSQAIRKYHEQMLSQALEKIETVPIEYRQLQSISIPMRTSAVKILKPLIDDFLDEAARLVADQAPEEIYNLNVQLIPITQLK